MKGFRHLKLSDRLKIEQMLKAGCKVTEIATKLGCHRATIYNELKRGQYEWLDCETWKTEMRYSPDIAQQKYEEGLKVRGTQLKIGNDIEFADYIEDKICNDKYSPEAVLGELQVKGNPFKTTICVRTLYSYIDKGIFLTLSNKDLPIKGNKKRGYHKIRRQARASVGTSIDVRDKSILDRQEFGHWEMDSVIGKRSSKKALLVLTERKTRQEIIFKVNDHTAQTVVNHIDLLEKKWGKLFPQIFKTITVDNGTEFSMADAMERNGRTKMYYCHAYCSCERGSNEKQNQMIRRKFPKGTDFNDVTDEQVKEAEEWLNSYPRKIFNYHSAKELFALEVEAIRFNSA